VDEKGYPGWFLRSGEGPTGNKRGEGGDITNHILKGLTDASHPPWKEVCSRPGERRLGFGRIGNSVQRGGGREEKRSRYDDGEEGGRSRHLSSSPGSGPRRKSGMASLWIAEGNCSLYRTCGVKTGGSEDSRMMPRKSDSAPRFPSRGFNNFGLLRSGIADAPVW